MQKLVEVCGPCFAASKEYVLAHQVMMSFNGVPMEVYICDPCEAMLVEPVRTLMDAFGKPARPTVTVPDAPPGMIECLLCTVRVADNWELRTHHKGAHGLAKMTATEMYGLVCPVCEEKLGSGVAMGNHARTQHETHSIPELFTAAKRAGDPSGVIAKRVKMLSRRKAR